ncbi:MAG: hypothetical protein KF832_13410 [Caldilineaceae bacterium]|nr:hypothetical protein [Caldilineaceae bacterium]
MTHLYQDVLFAPLDADLHLERIAGGNETEVYCTDDRRYVVKVKHEAFPTLSATLTEVIARRKAARRFAAVMGPQHSIPNSFLIANDNRGQPHWLIIQPFYENAQPLFAVDYAQLDGAARLHLARQLLKIIRRSVAAYGKWGWMPDLYGRSSTSRDERTRLNRWYMFPWRLWSFLIQRNLLRAHNLMLTAQPKARIILVDYDPVTRGKLYQLVYYQMRLWLFWRDLILIGIMVMTGWVPRP